MDVGVLAEIAIMIAPRQQYDIVEARARIEAGKTTATVRKEIQKYDAERMTWVGTGRFEMRPCDMKELCK